MIGKKKAEDTYHIVVEVVEGVYPDVVNGKLELLLGQDLKLDRL